jgi:hypothetical protein
VNTDDYFFKIIFVKFRITSIKFNSIFLGINSSFSEVIAPKINKNPQIIAKELRFISAFVNNLLIKIYQSSIKKSFFIPWLKSIVSNLTQTDPN